MTIEQEIKRQKKIIEAATEGGWWTDGLYIYFADNNMIADRFEDDGQDFIRARGIGAGLTEKQQEMNMDFIAESRTAWPRVLKALEVATKELTEIFNSIDFADEFEPHARHAKIALAKIQEILEEGEK